MAWTTLPTYANGNVPTASELNQYVNNLEYLRAPNKASYIHTAGTDITSTSTTFASLNVNFELTITTTGGHVLLLAYLMVTNCKVDYVIDGSFWTAASGTGNGAARWDNTTLKSQIFLPLLISSPSAASHTYKLQFGIPSAGTATVYGAFYPRFFATEFA